MNPVNVSTEKTGVSKWAEIVSQRAEQARHKTNANTPKKADKTLPTYANRLQAITREYPARGELFEMLCREVRQTDVVIDIGPGPGRYTLPLAKRVKQIIAVERSPLIVDFLRQNLAAENISNVIIIEESFENAALPKADIILCSHILYEVSDISSFLKKMDSLCQRKCFIAHHARQFDWLGDLLWKNFLNEPLAPLPMFDELIEVLEEIELDPDGKLIMEPISRMFYNNIEEAISHALERMESFSISIDQNKLRQVLGSCLKKEGSRWYAPEQPVSGIVWWTTQNS